MVINKVDYCTTHSAESSSVKCIRRIIYHDNTFPKKFSSFSELSLITCVGHNKMLHNLQHHANKPFFFWSYLSLFRSWNTWQNYCSPFQLQNTLRYCEEEHRNPLNQCNYFYFHYYYINSINCYSACVFQFKEVQLLVFGFPWGVD